MPPPDRAGESRTNQTPRIRFEEAPARIRSLAEGRGERTIVGITGPVGSGKSTLAERLAAETQALVISTDDYLPDYEGLVEDRRDLPEHAHLGEAAEHLGRLQRGLPANIPIWSFHEHARTGSRTVEPPPADWLIVVEGIHALAEPIASRLGVAVFVEAPRDVRWARWEAIESQGERGHGVEIARAFFDNVAEPTFSKLAGAYRDLADLVVVNA